MLTSTLENIPDELFLSITACLMSHELASLMRTCRRFNALIEHILWTDIELHEQGFHESSMELDDPPPFIPPSQRRYHRKQSWGWGQGAQHKAGKLFCLLQQLHVEDPNRMQELAKRVRNLCTVIEPQTRPRDDINIQIWQLLPFFTNLETLELHGNSYYSSKHEKTTPEFTAAPLKLRFAKLFGYIPKSVARWVLRGGASLERLELGMLDRPISTNDSSKPEFSPLPEETLAGPDDEDYDWGSLDGESVIPRPQSNFLPDPSEYTLSSVKHMYLCQPSPGDYSRAARDYTWSTRAEDACLSDWRSMLLATGPTLETLVLEQRPAAAYIENDCLSEVEFLRTDTGGSGNGPLVRMVERLIYNKVLPELKKVYLYGMVVGEDLSGRPSEGVPAGRLMRLLEANGVQCEARLGKWCFFDDDPGWTQWARWHGTDDQDDEDDDEEEDEDDNDIESKMKWHDLLASV
ncbi:hypothetical protein B0J13DRAFT_579682 [Dactylonectria estremocensis]|uniref:F-box domain-containing protein n=1 Tax=Dactylonectria estremocensis TaxID=1079267 RepID=A0A9P9CX02_9HYPO|nr:hypothetical protein B0J13DRAFT_579682 [Dactylonectria estremocensis]